MADVPIVTGSARSRVAVLLTAFVIMPAIVYAQSVTATWDPRPPSENVTSYGVCIGSSPGSCNIQTASVPGNQAAFRFVPAGGVMHYVSIRAINASGAGPYSAPVGFSIPGFQPSNQATAVGSAVTLNLAIADPDGSSLTITHTGLPVGLSINSATRQISGTPTAAGTYEVTLYVNDGLVTVSRAFTWVVVSGTAVVAKIMRPAADFDGDRRADMWRYELFGAQGVWRVRASSAVTDSSYPWGGSGDIPVPADYDGDGRADLAVYRPSTGAWFILKSTTNYSWNGTGYGYVAYQWGLSGDVPVPADYDGDRRPDLAVFRPSTGVWYILKSTRNYLWQQEGGYTAYQWGTVGDISVPGDYDGDGRADLAVFRPSTRVWYIKKSTVNYSGYMTYAWGTSGDIPVPADFDGDGRSDIAVWRATGSLRFFLASSSSFTSAVTSYWP
jgi:hypothetical protein